VKLAWRDKIAKAAQERFEQAPKATWQKSELDITAPSSSASVQVNPGWNVLPAGEGGAGFSDF
jgi:hypothetical protein